MSGATKVCGEPGCPNLAPCSEHTRKPWSGSRRAEHAHQSGWERQAQNRRIMRRHRGICHVCGQPGADEVDDVTPLAEGGRRIDSNLRPIHARPCHQQKTAAEAARARARRTTPGG